MLREDADNANCANLFICEAAYEAAKIGQVGHVMAQVASSNAEAWLTNINLELFNGTSLAGLYGLESNSCTEKFMCHDLPSSYKKPSLLQT